MPLGLNDPVRAISPRLASRRMGAKAKGRPAEEVLADPMGIETVGALLHHYPRRYIDRSHVTAIRDLRAEVPATVIAHVRSVRSLRTRQRNKSMVVVKIADASGSLDLTFFNQPWLASSYRAGMELAVTGLPTRYKGRLQLSKQEVEVLSGDDELVHMGRITPVHRASEGIATRTIRELVWKAFEQLPRLEDPLPPALVEAEGLGSYDWAIRRIHFPEDGTDLARARERLKFDELFTLELGVAFRKARLADERTGVEHDPDNDLVERFATSVPFEPTGAQRRAAERIGQAMADPRPMNLLLQGDVGAGKTLVAVQACLVAIGSGHQAAIMAPTEVLAGQHERSVAALLEGIGAVRYLDLLGAPTRRSGGARAVAEGQASLLDIVEVPVPVAPTIDETLPAVTYALLSGSVTGKDRERILAGVADGSVDLVVGTHALVQESVTFADLSLAVVDEQHRFGLHQRTALKGKGGGDIDVLIMTATPIPRTLALTYYGDLDVVVLDELPAGRRPIRTIAVRSAAERRRAYELVRGEIVAGRQAFVVCAAIDEDNRTQVRAAEAEADRLATEVFPELRVEVLHGRMRPKDKERTMDAFRAGEADLLISTTVIEVGVDVPNATAMLIENAERFGLAQLHQLRGRIGRGAHASTCVLFDASGPDNEEARARIDAMVRTTDGFELADEDLRLRGEGTLFDTKQSGMPDLHLARLAEDLDLVQRARARAFAVIEDDPRLETHPELLRELRARFDRSIDWLFRS